MLNLGLAPANQIGQRTRFSRSGAKSGTGTLFQITLIYEDLEYPAYGTTKDRIVLRRPGGMCESAEMCRFTDERAMGNAIGLFTETCAKC
jgi:hypothetical protein